MAPRLPDSTADAILALQLTVAWAGEGRCEPSRLGWWQTDLVDPAGGGDLLARLLPRTHAWAGLQAVREAARRADAQLRRQVADPDRVRTLFFLGFDVDERLDERLAELKRGGAAPADALPLPVDLGAPFDRAALEPALRRPGAEPAYQVAPGGRELRGPAPAAQDLLVQQLAAALLPFPSLYPLPFYRVAT